MRDDTSLQRSSEPASVRRPTGVGWSVLAGSVTAMVAVFAIVTLGVGAVTESHRMGALMGAFCAGWGGVGFGVMFGGALAVLREDPGDVH
jgi:hypothetical protein